MTGKRFIQGKYRVIVTFSGTRNVEQPDGNFTMMHAEESSVSQTFVAHPGEPLNFHKPDQFESLSFTVDYVELIND